MDKRDTDIRNPDGFILKGENVGHADKSSTIRRRDGVLFRGEKMGYVDQSGKIRRPDGFIFRGEEVGQIKENRAYDKDGIIFSGEEWGYVDAEGNIRQKDGLIFKGRIIGQMRGKDKGAALGYFVLKFKEMEGRFNELENSVRSAENKTHYLTRLQKMLTYVPDTQALGDFDGLINRIKRLEREIVTLVDENRRRKEDIVRQSETLSHSTNWKMAGVELKKLQEQWSQIYSAGKDHDEALWRRFRSAQDDFYRHRSEHFDKENRLRQDNQRRKEQLCTKAESLASSRDSKAAIESIKELQAEWKSIGPVPKEQVEPLWQRFRSACDRVFEHARQERERKQEEWRTKMQDALERKRDQAERLRESIAHDESNIERWHDTIYNLHDGGRADEIRDSLESKISDVEGNVRSKQDRLSDLEDVIRDIETKLYH